MRTRTITASCVIALTISMAGPARLFADDHGALLNGYTMTSWTLADGIPVGPVYAMVQDAEGYLWLGTTSGVVRFDGARFSPWEAIASVPLPRAEAQALAWSRTGTLWIGFGRIGGGTTVGAFRNGILTRVSAGVPPRGTTISVLEDAAGRVWAVSDSALHRLRDGRWDVMKDGALGRAEVVSVREDRTGAIWIGTRQGVFRTHDGQAFTLVDDGVARETSESADGEVWTTDPVHGARRQGARAPLTGIDGRGMRLLHDSRGNLWVATTGQGLWRVRDTSGVRTPLIERATTQTGLSSNAVQSLLEDREGNVWVGTMLGLHSLTPQELTPLASGAMVRAILPDADGSVWVGTANGLVQYRRDGGTWHGRAVNARWDIRSLFRDDRGHTWADTDHGLRTLTRGRLLEVPVSMRIAPGPAATGEQTVDTVFRDSQGTVWAGGTAGLSRLHEGQVTRLGESEGLPAQRVMAITQSDDGCLWLAVDRGPQYMGRRAAVVRLHPSDIEVAADGGTPLAGYALFDAVNGLAGVPVGPVSAARSSDGSLWFAFGGSVTVVDPERLSTQRGRAAALARIVGATIDDRTVMPNGTRALPAGTRKVQIDYTALRLTAPREIRFRYRLDGFDAAWVEAGPRRQAYYTNLEPGSYVFRVQADGDGAAWTVPEAKWPFTVQPAFWQTNWFYALCGTALLLAAWGAAHTRVWFLNRQFAATLAERTRLSREIHDTMLQSLVGIALQVQAIARRCSPHAADQRSQLLALRREVEEHIREARQAIQNLRSPMLEACGLAGALTELCRRLVPAPTRFEISACPIAGASAATEGELLRIAQEAITNAARHAGATRIDVALHQESGAVRLRVTDDGRGFDVHAMLSSDTGHYGLTGMQERAARIGGRLLVRSSTSGTLVEAIVPGDARPPA
jgi:ligand-binding sensor domain-containing protein/two-component sensor histidine kinase